MDDDEAARLALVQALVERRTLILDDVLPPDNPRTVRVGPHRYYDGAPTQPLLLAGVYEILYRLGLRLNDNGPLVAYLLTLAGVTLPAALSAGLVYRMGRLFELHRPWRAGLGTAVAFGSGLAGHARTLSPEAVAGSFLIAAAGCWVHLMIVKHPHRSGGWVVLAGFCAALAAAVDPAAAIFLPLFMCVPFALRWPTSLRLAGVLLYWIGALPPLALHASLVMPLTGTLLPPRLMPHESLQAATRPAPAATRPATDESEAVLAADDAEGPGSKVLHFLGGIGAALLGVDGVLTRYPIGIVGLLGMVMVFHRHWPTAIKILAAATAAGAGTLLVQHAFGIPGLHAPSTDLFIVFMPLTVFWAGAWLRRSHRPTSWIFAALALLLSAVLGFV